MSENDIGNVTDSVLWDSMKAVIRGDIISFQIRKNKEDKKRLNEIDKQMTELQEIYKTNYCSNTLKKIVTLRSEYNSILAKKIAKQLNKIKQRHFELGEKPHRLLARQLKQSQASRAIHKIQTESGEIITDPKRINKCFADFYKEVYTSKGNIDINEINKFLSNIDLPQINEEAVEMLEMM